MGYGAFIPAKSVDVTRTLGTTYTASNKTLLANYTVQLTVTASITGGQSAQVQAQIRPTAADPWETVASQKMDLTFTLAIVTVAMRQQDDRVLTFIVPKGYEYRVISSGAGTSALLYSKEVNL
ncbi:hypothetical protein [Zhongshania sp.]|uniref:hypothetical protein n=1 Tax=Zhongshania sp. TaxID=1971902 RepID=UPI00356A07AB